MSNSDPTSPRLLSIGESGRCFPIYGPSGPITDTCCLCNGPLPASSVEIADRHTGSDGGVCDQCCEKIDPDMFAVVQNLRALDALLKPHLPGLHSGKCVALTDMERFAWGAMSALCVHADKEFRPVTAPTPMTLLREYASTAGRPVDEVFVRRQGEHAGPYFVWAVAEGVEFRVAQVGRDDDAEFIAALIRERGHVPRGMRFGLHPGEHLTA